MYVRYSRRLGVFGTFDTQKHCTGRQTRLEVTSGSPGSPTTRLGVTSALLGSRKLGSRPLRGRASASPGSPRTRLRVTSESLGPRKLGSRSLRGHLAQENSARSHFEVTWVRTPWLEETSKSLDSGKLGSTSLRGRICHFTVTSKSLGSRRLESRSLRSFEPMQKKS